MLSSVGPLMTAKRVYSSFSSRDLPTANKVVQVFRAMAARGLGHTKRFRTSQLFYKALPSTMTEGNLKAIDSTREAYEEAYRKRDDRLKMNQLLDYADPHHDDDDELKTLKDLIREEAAIPDRAG